MQKIIPCLWFNKEAEEAAALYSDIFDGKISRTVRYPEAGKEVHGQEPGSVMTVEFEILGFSIMALNGGPLFKINPSISFMISCPNAKDVADLYSKLAPGGMPLMPLGTYPFSEQYGWIQDKYGISWQIGAFPGVTEKKIHPALMFTGDMTGKAEEAAKFYTSIFKNSSIEVEPMRYGPNQAPDKESTIAYMEFVIEGQKFSCMDSGRMHAFTFNEAISLMVMCENQEEIDYYWEKLSAHKENEQCGWLKDKYGVSWQITPRGMDKILNNSDKEKANRGMEAMLKMKKIVIKDLEEAVK